MLKVTKETWPERRIARRKFRERRRGPLRDVPSTFHLSKVVFVCSRGRAAGTDHGSFSGNPVKNVLFS